MLAIVVILVLVEVDEDMDVVLLDPAPERMVEPTAVLDAADVAAEVAEPVVAVEAGGEQAPPSCRFWLPVHV